MRRYRISLALLSLCLALLLTTACSQDEREGKETLPLLSDVTVVEEDANVARQRDALWLQIDLARAEWAANRQHGGEALEALAAVGRSAVAVAENPAATEAEMKEARLALKTALATYQTNMPGGGDVKALGQAILAAEDLLDSLSGDKKGALEEALRQAYACYRADASVTEAEQAVKALNAAVEAAKS